MRPITTKPLIVVFAGYYTNTRFVNMSNSTVALRAGVRIARDGARLGRRPHLGHHLGRLPRAHRLAVLSVLRELGKPDQMTLRGRLGISLVDKDCRHIGSDGRRRDMELQPSTQRMKRRARDVPTGTRLPLK
jgi:hypothetical protein